MSGPRWPDRPDAIPGAVRRSGEAEGSKAPRGTARDRALRLLAVRDRSRRELETRLLRAGFDPAAVADALEGLSSSGLIDDERFARALAEQTVVVRGSGRRAALEALRAKGVARDVAERAVEGAAGEDEEARAEDLARRRATRLTGLDPARAGRRLLEFLIRRGYEPAVARRAAARALGEHVSAD